MARDSVRLVMPSASTPIELGRVLPDPGTEHTERGRAEIASRTLDYAYGSGEADEIAVCAGLKPMLRQCLRPEVVGSAEARLEAMGLVTRRAHDLTGSESDTVVLYAGRDARRLEEAGACEAHPDHDLELARLLGYPRCCAEAYIDAPLPRANLRVLRRAYGCEAPAHPHLNILDTAVFHYVSWLPCTGRCSPSLTYAEAVRAEAVSRHGQLTAGAASASRCPPGCRHASFIDAVDVALSAHRLALFEHVQLSLQGAWGGDVLTISRVWPTARDRHPNATLAAEAATALARLLALITPGKTLRVSARTLFVDGHPLVETPDLTLVRFSP